MINIEKALNQYWKTSFKKNNKSLINSKFLTVSLLEKILNFPNTCSLLKVYEIQGYLHFYAF